MGWAALCFDLITVSLTIEHNSGYLAFIDLLCRFSFFLFSLRRYERTTPYLASSPLHYERGDHI